MYTQTLKDVHSPKLNLRDTFTKPTRFWTFDVNYNSKQCNKISIIPAMCWLCFFLAPSWIQSEVPIENCHIAMGQNDWTPKMGLPMPILRVPLIPLIWPMAIRNYSSLDLKRLRQQLQEVRKHAATKLDVCLALCDSSSTRNTEGGSPRALKKRRISSPTETYICLTKNAKHLYQMVRNTQVQKNEELILKKRDSSKSTITTMPHDYITTLYINNMYRTYTHIWFDQNQPWMLSSFSLFKWLWHAYPQLSTTSQWILIRWLVSAVCSLGRQACWWRCYVHHCTLGLYISHTFHSISRKGTNQLAVGLVLLQPNLQSLTLKYHLR